jgi:dethiobiotin synthetase
VGKTYVTAALIRALRHDGVNVGAYKPVATGAEFDAAGRPRWEDVEALAAALEHEYDTGRICPQRFQAAVAPPVAAGLAGGRVDAQRLRDGVAWWRGRVDVLLVEGVGGLLCPLTEHETVADLAGDLRLPLLIVARQALGTINHTLLTIEAARSRGLTIAGVVLNEVVPVAGDASVETNADEIETRGGVPVLASVPHADAPGLLLDRQGRTMGWQTLYGVAGCD